MGGASMAQQATPEPALGDRLTVQGVRETQGDAVECPKIRTDDGRVIAISYLPSSIAIGDRVEVTGVMANKPTCLGPVLRADETRPLN